MTGHLNHLFLWISVAVTAAFGNSAHAGNIFLENWESPAIPDGTTSTSLPASWSRFSGPTTSSLIFHPSGTADFNQTDPLSSPAGGNQLLSLSGTNTGVYRMSGVLIQADTTYTLSAAIGDDKLTPNSQYWSLQLWANTSGTGQFVGSAGGDTFIGQQFGTTATAVNPTAGNWAWNSFTFNSSTTPNLVGQELIVFLNNFDDGTSYYDNVSLSSVPEPSSVILAGIGIYGIVTFGRRSRRGS
jgi:PEP-CTERM motif